MKRLDRYSQHFLRNPRFIRELIGNTSINNDDVVLDIGAGSGIISSVLSELCLSVIAVEADPRIANKLRVNMERFPNVIVKEDDFLSLSLPESSYKIFANIPFHLSSAIVKKLTEAINPPADAYLIVQKQFGRKLLPEHTGFTSQLGILIGPKFAVRIRRTLRRTDYWPHPNVDTVLLEIHKREAPLLPDSEIQAFQRLVSKSFPDPVYFTKIIKLNKSLHENIKPSQLTLTEWISLYHAVTANSKRTPRA